MNNVDGLVFTGGLFTPSTTNKASTEWLRLVNCTGSINGVSFNDLTKAGTLNGNLSLRGNVVFCTDGFTLTGGVITAGSNEFSKGTNAYYLDPTGALTVDLGPDLFKSNVTNSYNIPADSTNLAGFIHYDSANDASTNRFSNASGRIQIRNIDEKQFSVSTTPYTVLKQDTGRTIQATGGSNQTFTMPNSIPGTLFKINKQSSVTLTINLDAGDNLYTGTGAAKSSVSVAAGDVGGTITLEAYSTVGWLVTSLTGTWTFS
jgi:hypothetical protein